VIKAATCFNRPIYVAGREPDEALARQLIERYHTPYHNQLAAAVDAGEISLALDCHSMLPSAPPISADPGRPRPLFCLGNRDGATAPHRVVAELASAIVRAFELGPADVSVNDPFAGGYITQRHGTGPVPWIQVEMNRSLYLDRPWFDPHRLAVDGDRLAELRDRFRDALWQLCR
jgi:formiminoglutamase